MGEDNGHRPVPELILANLGEQNGKVPTQVIYSVIHACPGRMRLRVPRLRHDLDYTQRLRVLLEADPLILSIRIQPAAASLAVTYQAGTAPEAKIRSHLGYLLLKGSQKEVVLPTAAATRTGVSLSAVATGLAVLAGPLGLPIPPMMVVGAIALATVPVLRRAWTGIITQRQLSIDFLDLVAIAITTAQGQLLTPSLMLSLIEIGENIRDRTAHYSQIQALDLLGSFGQQVWVERDGEKLEVPLSEVQLGETVIVYPGEQVPVDGTILRGQALLDEQKLTGESMPIFKTEGQPVFASTLVREGGIYILVERVGNSTRAGQSIQLIQAAPVHDTRMENYAAKIAQKAVVPTLCLAGVVFAATRNPARAASILTLDFATGIRVSIPTTVLAALTYAARRGILIRSGRALEQLALVDTIVFDKTGTLTKGEVAVTGVESLHPGTSKERVLELAAAAEQRLTHPVAEAVIRYAQALAVNIPERSQWDYQLGLGVEAKIEGEIVYVGSDRFLRQQGVDLTQLHTLRQEHSVIYVASNGQLLGRIHYRDMIRPESQQVITQLLKEEGVEVHILTGDQRRTARRVAEELGILESHTHAEAFPEQKAAVVRQLHEQRKTVAFVGDGINDSPALAYADVSVSFAGGSDIARETADVVLMENDLRGLLEAIAIARRAKHLIEQNTRIIAIPNLGGMAVAVLFGLNPLTATIVNNGSTVVAGLNGLRPIFKSLSSVR